MNISITKVNFTYLAAIAAKAGHSSIKEWLDTASEAHMLKNPQARPQMLKAGRKPKSLKNEEQK